MNAKKFAYWGGLVMLAMGVFSLIPGLVGSTEGLPALFVETSYGRFLNIFPMNIFNKVALILFGIAGLMVSQTSIHSITKSRFYSRIVFYLMGTLAIFGLFPQTNTMFGYWPLFGAEVFAHGALASIGAYCTFSKSVAMPHTTGLAERYP